MSLNRRHFLKSTAAGAAMLAAGCRSASPNPFSHLSLMTGGVQPISDEEHWKRIKKAQQYMTDHRMDAVFLDGGTSMRYFADLSWWQSERMKSMVIPAKGDPFYVLPAFEAPDMVQEIRFGGDILTWEEDESPYEAVVAGVRARGLRHHRLGFEERVRFFLFDGIRRAVPDWDLVSADPVVMACRLVKSPAEIALMQKASDITVEAYKAVLPLWKPGMSAGEFTALSRQAHEALGAPGSIHVQIGEASAYPHGSSTRTAREGDVILMDGGCSVGGYRSDISRTIVLGKPTDRQVEMWSLAGKAKEAAFAAAKPGIPCEAVDAAARQVYADYGFGPGYKLPGCPHRTGHGIGMDGHEGIHLVRGNRRPLEPGMCFSNEPMVVLPGEFGIRLEDCFYMTEHGPRYFSEPSPAIDRPMA